MDSHSDIRRIIDAHAAAVPEGDVEKMLADIADDVIGFDVIDPLRRVGRASLRERATEWVASYEGSINWENRDITIVVADEAGFASMLCRVTGTLKTGSLVDMWFRKTLGLQKRDGRWIIVHDHASVPFNPENGQASLGLKP